VTADAGVRQPPAHRFRYLVAVDDQPRARRASDVTMILIGLLLAGWGILVFKYADTSAQPLSSLLATLPTWVVSSLQLLYSLGFVYSLSVVIELSWARRGSALRDVAAAGVLAALVTLGLMALFNQLWPVMFPEFTPTGEAQFPVMRVAAVAAVLIAASPHLARPIRRLGWGIVFLTGLAAAALGFGEPSGAISAVGIGMVCAGGVLLAFGSPRGYPDVASVAEGLTDLGLPLAQLRIDPDQSWGVRRMVGFAASGREVEVKAFGRDATDSQFAAKVWRAVTYRGEGGGFSYSRLQAAEHEALVTVLAGRAGVRVPEVLAAASPSDEVAVLVVTRRGVPLVTCDRDRLRDADLVQLWRDVVRLHDAGITHGSLDTTAVRWAADGYVLGDFSAGSLHFRERDAQLDVVRLLFGLGNLVGVDRAVATAREGLGPERLGAALPYLQTPALTTREREHMDRGSRALKDLRARVVEVTGAEAPDPVKLRRLSLRDVLTLVVLLLFLGALLPVLAGVDYAQLWAELQNASGWIVAAAVVLGQLTFIPQATAMMFAVGRSIPLRPMAILQSAIAFISFAIPGVAGRVTMNAAFLCKYGVPPAVAVAQGGIDGFSGFVVQIVLLVLALATGTVSVDIAVTSPSGVDWGLVLAIVFVLATATGLAVWKVKRLHDRVLPALKSIWRAMTDLLKSPSRALGLFGSQVLVQLTWGLILSASLQAVGFRLDFISCTVVVVATCLFQGVIPVPGGIGVSEAVMIALLIPLGVPSGTAMAATVVWRVSTFYLPATEGFFASKWLEKHGYL